MKSYHKVNLGPALGVVRHQGEEMARHSALSRYSVLGALKTAQAAIQADCDVNEQGTVFEALDKAAQAERFELALGKIAEAFAELSLLKNRIETRAKA